MPRDEAGSARRAPEEICAAALQLPGARTAKHEIQALGLGQAMDFIEHGWSFLHFVKDNWPA